VVFIFKGSTDLLIQVQFLLLAKNASEIEDSRTPLKNNNNEVRKNALSFGSDFFGHAKKMSI